MSYIQEVYRGREIDLVGDIFRFKNTRQGKVIFSIESVKTDGKFDGALHVLSVKVPEGDSVINGPIQLSTPLQTLIGKALSLCELMLTHCQAFYPFAGVYEDGKASCLFADDITDMQNESYLIEQLQWRIIDTTTDTHSHSILVYAATVTTDSHKQLDAIAINATDSTGHETVLLYPYKRVAQKVIISPPMNHTV